MYDMTQGAQCDGVCLKYYKFIGKTYTHLRHEGIQGAMSNAYRRLFSSLIGHAL